MKIFNKRRIDKEKITNQKLNIKRIEQYKKKSNEPTTILDDDAIPLKEDKLLKEDNQTIINNNNIDNSNQKVSCKTINSIMVISSSNKKNKPINIQKENKNSVLIFDTFKEIHEQNRKNNTLEKIVHYQCIVMLLYIVTKNKSYISELKSNLNYVLNLLIIFIFLIIKKSYLSNEPLIEQIFIWPDTSFINKNIISIFVIGIFSLFTKIKFTIMMKKFIYYVKGCYNKKIYPLKITFFTNEIKELLKIFKLNERKKLFKKLFKKIVNKGEKNKTKNKLTIYNYILITLIKYILLVNLFCRAKGNLIIFEDSKITLKVKWKGENAIINRNFININYLKEVYINNNKQKEISFKYNFEQEDNFVELIWDENIASSESMFKDCKSITEINLSNFDTSLVSSMDFMFERCKSLTSLDLSNFNTSLVKRMIFMFSGCSSLTILNLTNFDTSLVTLMDSMFSHCSSLTSLDLSNFNTSLLDSADSMFYDCVNLSYLNLYNFSESKVKLNMFKNVPNNLVICIKETINKLLYEEFNNTLDNESISFSVNKKGFIFDCSKDWKTKQKRIIKVNRELKIFRETAVTTYPYCYSGYYPIENQPFYGYYNSCYKDLEGYYLDNLKYKKCYDSCKNCSIGGNISNHNCIYCNETFPFWINKNNYLNCYENCSYYYYFDEEYNYNCTMNLSCPNEYPNLIGNRECVKYYGIDLIIKYMSDINNTGIEESK